MSVPSQKSPQLAFSYLRFSSDAQADGDSVRRQTALRDAWLEPVMHLFRVRAI
jgi:hypothetical protein